MMKSTMRRESRGLIGARGAGERHRTPGADGAHYRPAGGETGQPRAACRPTLPGKGPVKMQPIDLPFILCAVMARWQSIKRMEPAFRGGGVFRPVQKYPFSEHDTRVARKPSRGAKVIFPCKKAPHRADKNKLACLLAAGGKKFQTVPPRRLHEASCRAPFMFVFANQHSMMIINKGKRQSYL